MAKRYRAFTLLAALLLSGCVAYTQSRPQVEGRLLDSHGQPVAGAEIVLESYKPLASTVSDSAGRFAFTADHEWSFFLPIGPIDKINMSRLDISARGQRYNVLLSYGLSGPYGSGPAGMRVVCTLPPSQQTPDPQTGDADICQHEMK